MRCLTSPIRIELRKDEYVKRRSKLMQYLIEKEYWKVEELKVILEQNSSTLNKHSKGLYSPLVQVLRNNKCSLEIVKLFLDYGANVNKRNDCILFPLTLAVGKSRSEAIIKALVEKTANVNATNRLNMSNLCVALHVRAPRGVIKLLLDAGCSVNACKAHDSVLDCVGRWKDKEIPEGVIELLIKAGQDVHGVNSKGQSAVCLAIQAGAGARDIKFLLKEGALLNQCSYHTSVMHCAVDGGILKEDVVQFLIDKGAGMDKVEHGSSLLHKALKSCRYELNAIKLLLDQPGVDVNKTDRKDNNLLHSALKNVFYFKLDVLKYLIQRGALLDKVNNKEKPPLCYAVILFCQFNVHPNVIQILLNTGVQQCYLHSAVKLTLKLEVKKQLVCFKMLLKYYFLQNWKFSEDDMICRHEIYISLMDFVNECAKEVREMSLKKIGYGHTLQEFVSHPSPKIADYKYNFNQLLEVLTNHSFPLFLDLISSKIGRPTLMTKLQELQVYAVKNIPSPRVFKRRIFLDYASVCVMVKYFSDEDILRMILTIYNSDNHTDYKYPCKGRIRCKRSRRQSSKVHKRRKLYH